MGCQNGKSAQRERSLLANGSKITEKKARSVPWSLSDLAEERFFKMASWQWALGRGQLPWVVRCSLAVVH